MGKFPANPLYRDPALLKKIYDLKSSGEFFTSIANKINEEFKIKISSPTVKKLYEEYIARNLVIASTKQEEKTAEEVMKDYQSNIEERFEKLAKVTDSMMELLLELKQNLPAEMYAKYIPLVLQVSRETLAQLRYIREDQQQILVNQKNVIYSPMQIMKIMNVEMNKMEKEGRGEFKATDPNRLKLTQTEKKIFDKYKVEEEMLEEEQTQQS